MKINEFLAEKSESAKAEKAAKATLEEQATHKGAKQVTPVEVAKSVAKGGFPKVLTIHGHCFGGITVVIANEKDLAAFWDNVYSNLSEEALETLKEGVEPLLESDFFDALVSYSQKASLGASLAESKVKAEHDLTVDGESYVLTDNKLIVNMNGEVVADVSDIDDSDPIKYGTALAEAVRSAE